jgi:hypothetical protein
VPRADQVAALFAQQAVVVIFITSDPDAVGDRRPGTVGVVQKPILDAASPK